MRGRSLLALCLAVTAPGPAATAGAGAADALVARVVANQATRGAVIRAKLTVGQGESDPASVAQLRIRVRHDARATRLLFEVLWPDRHKGEAVCIERPAGGALGGFLFEPPGTFTPVGAATMSRAFLESDLTVEDLADGFWQWPSPQIAGDEVVRGEPCTIVAWRPPPAAASGYSLVRAWISRSKLVPLRIEKIGRGDPAPKVFTVLKTSRTSGVWVPVTTEVETGGRSRRTTLAVSRGDRDVDVPLEAFSPESVGKPRRKP